MGQTGPMDVQPSIFLKNIFTEDFRMSTPGMGNLQPAECSADGPLLNNFIVGLHHLRPRKVECASGPRTEKVDHSTHPNDVNRSSNSFDHVSGITFCFPLGILRDATHLFRNGWQKPLLSTGKVIHKPSPALTFRWYVFVCSDNQFVETRILVLFR